MHHAPFPIPAADLGRHIHEALDLPVQVAVSPVPAVLSPLTREEAALRGIGRQRRDGVSEERESLRLVEPGTAPPARREELPQERGVDDADDGLAVQDEADRHAEHGKQVRVVDGAVQRVDAPGRLGIDQVLPRRSSRVRLLSEESGVMLAVGTEESAGLGCVLVRWESLRDGLVDEHLNICC